MRRELSLFDCSHPQAKKAVQQWHYSRSLPAAGLDIFGIKEDGRFIGVVIFGMGSNPRLASPFGLERYEVRELVRVALGPHRMRTSRIVAACLRRLHHRRPKLRLIISYADPAQGHHGGLYQAGNWTYVGPTNPGRSLVVQGRRYHPRSLYQRWRTSSLRWLRAHVDARAVAVTEAPKHKYAYPFYAHMRRRMRRLAQPYPSCGQRVKGDSLRCQRGEVRSIRTDRTRTTPLNVDKNITKRVA